MRSLARALGGLIDFGRAAQQAAVERRVHCQRDGDGPGGSLAAAHAGLSRAAAAGGPPRASRSSATGMPIARPPARATPGWWKKATAASVDEA